MDAIAAAAACGFRVPTPIQQKAIPLILRGEHVLLGSQTGSGKTLAYTLPILDRLRREELAFGNDIRREGKPRALILTPTPELARQVISEVKSLSHHLRASSAALEQHHRLRVQREQLRRSLDIVAATPSLVLRHVKRGSLSLRHLRTAVVDEAEAMLTGGFADDVLRVLKVTGRRPDGRPGVVPCARADEDPPVQLVLATATLTHELRTHIATHQPFVRCVEAEGLHLLPPKARVHWLRLDGVDRFSALANALHGRGQGTERTIVFCNTVQSARAAEHTLRERGLHAASCHGKMPPALRRAALSAFHSGDVHILVATDAASRGLDCTDVKHVILADFPRNWVDFVHRAGRTARNGASGRVTVLVGGAREQDKSASYRRQLLRPLAS